MKTLDNIPVIDINDKNFEKKLKFEIWSTQSNSDYRNDRERPYNGQPHTDQGERGKTEVKGLTMRDIVDCMVQGFLASSRNSDIQRKVVEINKELQNTEYASKGTWRYQDVYETGDIDPLAAIQNTVCFIEHYMGIFPNIPKFLDSGITKQLDL